MINFIFKVFKMEAKNIDTIIQNLVLKFNNKDYQSVIDESLKLVDQNFKIPIIFNLLGASYFSLHDADRALIYYFRAVEINSQDEEIHRNIAKCYMFQKKYKIAEEYLNKSLVIKKLNADALFNIGLIKILLNEFNKSINFLKQALDIQPNFTECLYNLGLCYKNLGDYKTAIIYYSKAIQNNPKHLKSYNNLGVCFFLINDYENAIKNLKNCLDLKSNYPNALSNLGSIHLAQKNFKEAKNFFTSAYALDRNLINAGIQKIYLERRVCDWSSDHEINSLMNDSITLDADVIPWQCLAIEDNPSNHLKRAEKYSRNFHLKSDNTNIYNNSKIRIGYFAIDFHQHPGMINMLGIFKNHNKEKFEIIGFYYGNIKKDEMHYKIKNYFDEFFYVDNLSDEQIANLAKKNKIDIAINRSGHTDNARGNIFSFKPAPVQITYLGYPGTLGQEGIDYIISDKFVTPKEYITHYSEKIIYLTDCFYPKDDNRNVSNKIFNRSDLDIHKDSFVFCTFNNSYKITKEEFTIWMNVLKGVKNSYLVLLSNSEEMQENLKVEAHNHNVDPNYLKFVNYIDYEDHMARHNIFDLFLDSFNYNAHTSAVDSLWAELPILTKVGKSFSSRICGSILNSLKLKELITYSKQEYQERAIYYGNNKNKIIKIKNEIKLSKEKNNFYNIKKYTKKLEEVFEKAHFSRLKNNKPTSFEV